LQVAQEPAQWSPRRTPAVRGVSRAWFRLPSALYWLFKSVMLVGLSKFAVVLRR